MTPDPTSQRSYPRRTSKRQRMMTAGLLSGGAAGLLLLAPSLADAASPLADAFGQTTPPTTEPAADSSDDATATDSAETTADDDAIAIAEPGGHLRDVLQPLVDDGTITAEQLDAIVASVQSAAPDVFVSGMPQILEGGPGLPGQGRPDGPFPDVIGGHDGPGFPGGGMEIHAGGPGIAIEIGDGVGGGRHGGYTIDVIANTIGITAPDLVDQLGDGSTVAEIATAAGADPQAVIDALVADVQERLAAAVQSGRITQAEADERIEDATERITNFVNGTDPSPDQETADAGAQESTETESTATTETTTA
jgi:hypothetical protein